MREDWVHSETVFEGRIFSIRTGEVRLEDGHTAYREMVRHPGGVGVVPVHEGQVLLVRQFRVAIDKHILEIPAGKREGDEPAADRARAELQEEVGYRAGKLDSLGGVYVSVGYCDEWIDLFLARELTFTGQNLEHDERIEIVRLPFDDVRRRLREGIFEDAKTGIALQRAMYALEALDA